MWMFTLIITLFIQTTGRPALVGGCESRPGWVVHTVARTVAVARRSDRVGADGNALSRRADEVWGRGQGEPPWYVDRKVDPDGSSIQSPVRSRSRGDLIG